MYKILNKIGSPDDLKGLSNKELVVLCHEARQFLVESISQTGGHLSSNLGVVELSVALHYVFESPKDKLIWDVGHQAYVHKLLTGRREQFNTLRQYDGMSGFLKRRESEHDIFEAGHSSTSISAGVGIATARDLKKEDFEVVSIIGDGALTGGMALEALNYLGHSKTNMKVILNDNEMSISKNIGGLSKSLGKLRTTNAYSKVKRDTKATLARIPSIGENMIEIMGKLKDSLKYFVVDGGLFFEEIGLTYIGPVDGHDLKGLIETLEMVKHVKGPVVVHVLTKKGKGYHFAEMDPNKYHGVGIFDSEKDIKVVEKQDFSKVFGDSLLKLAERDKNVIAISAAMIDGTGLTEFSKKYPERIFDVAIAEQHAVTMAAGMALQGLKPFVAVYSTFLQRAYDQIIHDVCIQKSPVVLCLDRAGIVGNDGETHHGVFDISYLNHMPNLTIFSPKDKNELEEMMSFATSYKDGPIAIRYPRGNAYTLDAKTYSQRNGFEPELLSDIREDVIIATGKMVSVALKCSEQIDVGVINVSQIKPLNVEKLYELLRGSKRIFTLEDHALKGGFGEQILSELLEYDASVLEKCYFKKLGIPDLFVSHGDTERLMKELRLDVEGVISSIRGAKNV